MPIASTNDQLALQASIREWAKRAAAIDVVRGLEPPAGRHGVATTTGSGPAAERWTGLAEFLLTRCLSIAGGTTQILLSLVAERLLGLPREEMR